MASFIGGVYTSGYTDPTIGAIDPMHNFNRNALEPIYYAPAEYSYNEEVFDEVIVTPRS